MSYIIPTSAFLVTLRHKEKFVSVFININPSFNEEDYIELAIETGIIEFGHSEFNVISTQKVEVSTNSRLVFFKFEKADELHEPDSQPEDSYHIVHRGIADN